ncbi:polyadenylate-binding protein 1-like [Sinocyclocheilus rhinocerous]|uniref:polyadenylate-binding protein 1-like n=1 Tax=Sinocyclocheilus rhinocerous TaxID=307959 RepID=UPI0007B9A62B|nr:PREDICTED: polyadenylate-binding protein 1-like [Sinocyclocheilus rhinocerous]
MATSYNWTSGEGSQEPNDHGSSLLVSDLHPDVTEQLLHAIFSPFGPICSVRVCRNTITNRSRGYGFVTFEHRQHAENALEALNFLELMGKPMCITWAQHITINVLARPSDRPAIYDAVSNFGEIMKCREGCDRSGESKEKESSSNPQVSLIVNDLHPNVTEQDLHALFFPFGPICTVKVCRDIRTNLSRGYGFVIFKRRHDAEKALKALTFSELMGKPMNIMWAKDMTVKVLSRDDERGFRDIYADETEPTESRGRRLANAVKSFFTTSLSSPGTWLGIGLFALAIHRAHCNTVIPV